MCLKTEARRYRLNASGKRNETENGNKTERTANGHTVLRTCSGNAPINVSPHPPLPGEVGQSWGFDLIRIQLPHPPDNVRIQILTGHALRVFRKRTLAIEYPDPWGKPAIPNKENSPPCPGWGVGANIDRRITKREQFF